MSDFQDDDEAASAPPAAPGAPTSSAAGPSPAPAPSLREDQIVNAVAFLSHPKVRASAAASKREFLQRKGLSEAEIDEAFRRVPQPAELPAAAAAAAAAAPAAPAPSAMQATLQHLQPAAPYGQPQAQQQMAAYGQQPGQVHPGPPQQPGVRWTQVVLGAGFLGASAYAAKQLVWPHMEGAYRSWRGHPRPPPRPRRANGGEAAEGALDSDATRAVAEAIQAQTAELRTSIDSIKQLVAALEAQGQRGRAAEGGGEGEGEAPHAITVADLRQELRSFAETLHELASPSPAAGADGPGTVRLEAELGEIKGLLAEILRSPSGSRTPGGKEPGGDVATPVSVTSALAAHGLAPGVADASSPAAGAAPAAADGGEHEQQPQGSSHMAAAGTGAAPGAAGGAASPAPPPHPASYLEVLEMLEKGLTPPGIRTDINDKPPNPSAAPAEAKLKPRPKPWEKGGASGSLASSAAGGSSGSLSSLGLAAAPVAALPAAAQPVLPARGAAFASPPPPAPAGESSAELAARALSPVRAPSPADEAAAAQPEQPEQQAQQQQQAGADQREGQQAPGSSFQSPKRASSIYEAVAPAPESPHIIAGRLSPSAAGRSASGSFVSALVEAAEQRGSGSGPLPVDGSGIGRPTSRSWKPPPIPAPSLSRSSGASGAAGGAAETGAAAAVAPIEAVAAGGDADVRRSPSAASLGADFASA